jgi:hypothetical protein
VTAYLPALLLLAATVAAWFIAPAATPQARVHLRFAAVLLAALSVSAPLSGPIREGIALLVLPLALAVLVLAAFAAWVRPLPPAPAATGLVAVCICALAAVLFGAPALSIAPCVVAAGILATLTSKRLASAPLPALQGMTSASAFFAAASAAALGSVASAVPLFAAAGLLGFSLAIARSDAAIEKRSRRDASGRAVGPAGHR